MELTDFINNNIDLIVNVVAAMLGISFPFLLQAINNIDEKYKSQSIISWFCGRTSYILFKQLLFVSVGILFLLIVLPLYKTTNNYCDTIQTLENIVVVGLVVILFFLAHDIMTYYRADELVQMFSFKGERTYKLATSKFISRVPLLQNYLLRRYNRNSKGIMVDAWSEFMTYLINNDNGKLARDAYQFLSIRILRLRLHSQRDVSYNESIDKAVVKLNSDLCKSQIKAFSIFSSNDLLASYSGQFDDRINSKSVRDTIWRCLMEQIYYDRDEMIYNHWEYATQRLTLFLKDYRRDDDYAYRNYVRKYKEFYIVLCAVLLGNKKYDLLSRLLFFSHKEPADTNDFALIPGTLSEIFSWYEILGKSQYEDNFSVESCYPIVGRMKSPFSGDQRMYCKEFLALLVVRLEFTRDFMYMHDRLDQPFIDAKTPIEIKHKIEILEDLMTKVKDWKSQKPELISTLLSEGFDSECDCLAKLQSFYDSLLEKQKEIKETQPDSPEIVRNMQDIICANVEERLSYYAPFLSSAIELPEHNDANIQDMFFKRIAYNNSSSYGLYPKSYFKDGQEVPIMNFPEALSHSICIELSHGIAMQFYLYDQVSCHVHYNELEKAFDIIKPNKDKHIILFFGISNPLEHSFKERLQRVDNHYSIDGVEIWLLPYTQPYNNKMLVIDKALIPALNIIPASKKRQEKYELKPISEQYPLMWSLLDPLQKEDIKEDLLKKNTLESLKDSSLLYIFLAYKIYIPENCIVRSLTVCDPYSSEVSKLEDLKEIE